MIKKILTFTLAVCMLLGNVYTVSAAPGDINIFDRETVEETVGMGAYVQDAVFSDNKVYFLFQTQIYSYTLGEEAPVLLSQFLPDEKEGNLWFSDFEQAQKKLGDNAQLLMQSLFTWEGKLYGYNQLSGKAMPIDTTTGEVDRENVIEMPLPAQEEDEEKGIYTNTSLEGVFNGKLFFVKQVYGQMGPEKAVIYSIDLTTKEKKEYQIEHAQKVFGYKDNALLVYIFDEMNSYDEQTQKMKNVQLMVYDLEQGTLTPFGEMHPYEAGGIVYSPKEDAIFYSLRGKIYKMAQGQPEEHVGYIDEANSYRDQRAWLTDDNMYILWAGSGSGIYVKNLDPQYMAQSSLLIYGGGYDEKAKKAFDEKYPDVPITYSDWESENYQSGQTIAQAIQSGETKVDIFFISPQYMNFKNLMKKEYALELTQNETIAQNIGRMYPFIQEAVTYEGKIYAVPTDAAAFAGMFYSPEAFKAIGLSEEDVPKTFVEFLELADRWDKELQEANPEYSFFAGSKQIAKSDLIYTALDKYVTHYQKQKEVISFDTPLFRKLMTTIEGMNIPMTINYEEEGEMMMDSDYEKALFDRGGTSILYERPADTFKSFLIPLDEGMELAVSVGSSVAFINPLSNNKELAMAYLEAMVTNYREADQVAMFTDKNEPIKNEYYEQTIKSLEESFEELKSQLETADEQDKKAIEEQIKYIEEALNDKDSFYWEVNQEAINRYEQYLPAYFIPESEALYGGEEDSNVYILLQNYIDGATTLDQFISEANRRVQMMALEMQ